MGNPTSPPAAGPPLEPVGWGAVVITPREIYDGLVRVSAQLAAIQQQLVQHTDEHERREEEIERRFREIVAVLQKYDERITAREKAAWPLPSIGALTAVIAILIAIFYHPK